MTKSFEEFQVYQLAMQLTKKVFDLLKDQTFDKEYEFKNQMKRAVLSISNNIAEGAEYNNNLQFIRFLKYAKGSCAEVRNMLHLAHYIFGINT
ncbi:four helix bundle protein [Riemerella columbina]|uniref:four helix bundle protein n=1 Tax=Riemerella columbina TaxID=103810 RepID=UPI00266FED0A|nr:four helix bundle protein [Riemerella columbina]WKS95390.1 four helix bundle protein [Riemerella columbina]